MNRILVPLDGSQFAESALPAALDLARACGAELHLVQIHEYVIPFPRAEALLADPEAEDAAGAGAAAAAITRGDGSGVRGQPVADVLDPDELQEIARREDAARLDALADDCVARAGVRTHAELLEGEVVATLARYIEDAGIDCVVMTTHGRGGLSRVWLGSVADALVRSTHVPVLLLRPARDDSPAPGLDAVRRILVPLDGSPLAECMIPPTLTLARALGAGVTLMHAIAPYRPNDRGPAPENGDAPRMDRARVDRYLEAQAERLHEQGVDVAVSVSIHASPALAILHAADARADTMIALATHGRSGWARVALGSVADKVLRAAAVPVLVLRPATVQGSDLALTGARQGGDDARR